ncbi:lymphocyte antigen 75-like [Discoglossus pictus]
MGFSWWVLVLWAVCLSLASAGPEALFTIRNEQTSKCLKSDNTLITLVNCSEQDNTFLWKWVSSHRLFNVGSRLCLGLDISKTQKQILKLFPCDSKSMLWWRCTDGVLHGASMYALTIDNGSVTAKLSSKDTWTRGNTQEDLCAVPYHVTYTKGGNSHGKPCELPFLYEGKVYHDCINHVNESRAWCATTYNYDTDQKWGDCIKSDISLL